ncbi:MAG: demethoxyubiquinone hydroxylase family protein [Methyloligellaceae bacterium]
MTPAQKTITRILKVNHAGEYGAIRIYRAQLWIARFWYPDTVDFLQHSLSDEIEHCRKFSEAMPQRYAKPCRVLPLWGNGGYILGFLTALMGRHGIWVCTAAVEAAVHRHLDDQLFFLKGKDPELHSLIKSIQTEELAHLTYAEERIKAPGTGTRLLYKMITIATDTVIWLSTWGDSTRMAKELASHKLTEASLK